MDTHALAHAVHVVGTRLTRCLAVVAPMLLAPAAAHAQLTETELFFELNNTDGDLGIHAALNGDGWRDLTIFDPGNRQMLDINVKGRLRK